MESIEHENNEQVKTFNTSKYAFNTHKILNMNKRTKYLDFNKENYSLYMPIPQEWGPYVCFDLS